MRDIKFRAKDFAGNWVYGYLAKFRNYKNEVYTAIIQICDNKTGETCLESIVSVDPETVGQFIGIKDKHGKEIYDGDIMESHCELQVVCYWRIGFDSGAGLCGYMLIPLRDFSFEFKKSLDRDFKENYTVRWGDDRFLDCDRCVDLSTDYVVGNIWDNPEMIKEGK